MMKRKAQAALEFLSFFGFFALAFLLVTSALSESQLSRLERSRGELAQEICLSLQKEMNSAFRLGDGYWKVVDTGGYSSESYSARISSGMITVKLGGDERAQFSAPLAGRSFTGANDSDGVIVPSAGTFTIRNRGGTVDIEH